MTINLFRRYAMCKFFQDTVKLFGNKKDKRKSPAFRMRLTIFRDRNEAVRYTNRGEAVCLTR